MPIRPNGTEPGSPAERPAPAGVRTGAHARGSRPEAATPAATPATAPPAEARPAGASPFGPVPHGHDPEAVRARLAAMPRPSADDPRILLDRQSGADLFEPIPPYPTRTEREAEFYNLGDGEMFLNVGPQHPATHGVLRLVLKLSGEQVVDVDPVIGYLHRGVEKICENSDYYHVIDQVDPLEYVSSLYQEWAAVLAFEKLMDVEVPRRAEYIRVLTAELLRVASHTLYMGFLALDLGGLTPILYSFIERDEIVEMLASVTGARMLFNYYRIGGVNGDLNHEFMSRLGDWMSRAAKQTEANATLLNENEIFVRRARGVGILDRETALRMGVTGGNLRASGVAFDLRRAHPYSVYPELEFNVPTREEGDSLARYLIRVDEVRESIRIIDQCLHNMPDGPIMAKLPRLLRPRPARAWGAVEGPRGMMGVYAISDGSDQPFRFRIHDPSLLNLQTVPHLLPGNLLADTMAIVSSLDPIMGGIDK
jgi:NADH-quinone oxidoreductase subunit D